MKHMKYMSSPLLTLIAVIIASVVVFAGCVKKEEKEIKIGAILPLTGSAAPYGLNAQRGIQMALDEINSKGGINGKMIEVIFEDSKTDPKESVTALQKLVQANKIRYIIGDVNSSGVLAMAPIAERNHIVLLSPGASNPKISDAGDYIFRNWHSDALEGEVDANFAFNQLGWKKVAVLYVNAAYGVGLAEVFRDTFKKLGGEIVAFEAYEQDATDMRTQINRIFSQKPDGIFLPGWPKEMSIALKQLRELKSKLPMLSVQGFDDPSILTLAGKAAEGVVFSVPETPNPEDELVKSFNSSYKQNYNVDPGVCSASGYDALRIYAWAIEKAGDNPEEVQRLMAQLKDFPGADGKITFDAHGDLLKPFSFKVVRQGTFASY
jgi:branched-chain amino acid transport system substrate-binding protein